MLPSWRRSANSTAACVIGRSRLKLRLAFASSEKSGAGIAKRSVTEQRIIQFG
jgi:hypothetical protein